MKNVFRISLLATMFVMSSGAALAADVSAPPSPSQDPIVQHLQLSEPQLSKIRTLHQELENNINNISMKDVKDGAIINIIRSGKWNESAVKEQLAAFSKVDQQERYYKVKYYFDLSQVLTPAQRQQVKDDLAKAATE
ncbi:Spy/CpxP family protein refolding chaperone [Klebsiella aerogenes]|uniref:Spy/CpxP family protein refolding chaperone n=1 Tax=Klebsiella aerogenes TaxID=548 RepID=UPI0034D1F6BF